MATITQLLNMSASDFKGECRKVRNRINSLHRSDVKGLLTERMGQELISLKAKQADFTEVIRRWF